MTPARSEALLQGQSAVARKVYECVPIAESWSAFQIMGHLRHQTGSTADSKIVSGCLVALVDAGLIRKAGRDAYQRLPVESKPKAQEPKMAEPVQIHAEQPAQRAATPLEVLSDLATEIVGMAEHMKRLAARVEDVALQVEQTLEAGATDMEDYRQLKALLRRVQGEGA